MVDNQLKESLIEQGYSPDIYANVGSNEFTKRINGLTKLVQESKITSFAVVLDSTGDFPDRYSFYVK